MRRRQREQIERVCRNPLCEDPLPPYTVWRLCPSCRRMARRWFAIGAFIVGAASALIRFFGS